MIRFWYIHNLKNIIQLLSCRKEFQTIFLSPIAFPYPSMYNKAFQQNADQQFLISEFKKPFADAEFYMCK